jgi:hypothetical protein
MESVNPILRSHQAGRAASFAAASVLSWWRFSNAAGCLEGAIVHKIDLTPSRALRYFGQSQPKTPPVRSA